MRYWPLVVLVVLVIAILATSRYTEHRKEANKNSAHQSSPSTPISQDDASKTGENAGKTEYPPSWVDTFAWPEGATVWALFLTLFVIAWQSAETREAAKATQTSAEATLKQVEIANKTLVLQFRPRVLVRGGFVEKLGEEPLGEPASGEVGFLFVNVG